MKKSEQTKKKFTSHDAQVKRRAPRRHCAGLPISLSRASASTSTPIHIFPSTMAETQQKPEEVKIEEIKEEDQHSDDEPPGLESTEDAGDKATKQSRTEKKSRKAIQKLGMKPVSGIVRVTVKKSKGVCYKRTRAFNDFFSLKLELKKKTPQNQKKN